ncbi:galectin-3-binding protein A-like [Halichoeres trimaculatus]|uniref:galectin-3-binding protein A-like n=1 Tax=Halichoeres trimaculatus TaxID=147232 RepID=UPI003D9E6CCF
MLAYQMLFTLWLLLLLHVSASALKFDLFRKQPELQEGDIRLFGSGRDSEGRVEVYHSGKWGTVCDDGWDMAEAQVVCRQLRFPGAKSVVTGKDYGKASGPIWLDDLDCKGTEKYLSTCTFKGWGLTDCSHKEDVGVICETGGLNMGVDDSSHLLDHSVTLSDSLGLIFDSRQGCDFLIKARSVTEDRSQDGTLETVETEICTHKLIMSQFPSFNTSEGSTSITVSISQSCQPYFTSFIRYIYTRKIDVTFASAQCLHWMASKFGMKQLMEDTGRLFSKILPEDPSFQTQLSLYEYAEATGDLVLQENCIQFLAWNFQNLTKSPVWMTIPDKLLRAILARSDLVVYDEYSLLEVVESWIKEKGNSTSLETQAGILNQIRFPVIPAEKLYDLQFNSSLYSTFRNLYREKMLKAFQFNVLLLSKLRLDPRFSEQIEDYKPRVYTSELWSTVLDSSNLDTTYRTAPLRRNQYGLHDVYYGNYGQASVSFTTPFHHSMMFKAKSMAWRANVLRNQNECSMWGERCESFPVARLNNNNYNTQQDNIIYHNRLVLMCQGKYICQVQDFKGNLAYIPMNNETQTGYPCPDDQYTYYFVVRPEYV